MNARLALSILAALVGGVVGGQLVSKEGDPSTVVADVERQLGAAFQARTIVVVETAAGVPFKTYKVRSPDGRVLEIQYDRAPSEDDLERIFAQSAARRTLSEAPSGLTGSVKKIAQTVPAWSELEPLWRVLTRSNQDVAKAKAMLHLSSRPTDIAEYTWNERFALGARPWQIEEPGRLLARRGRVAAGVAIGCFLFAFIALVSVTWLWGFLLARIRELSAAVRGK